MSKISVLFLGIKEWPANSGVNRAGGTGSYCDLLLDGLKDHAESIIVTQKSRRRQKFEERGSVSIYRLPTISNRVYKLVVGNLLCAIKAYFIMRKMPVDVIHAHTGWAIFYAYFLAKQTGRPLVATPHGDPYGYYDYSIKQFLPFAFIKLIKLIAKYIFPKADLVVVFTDDDKAKLLEHTNARFDNLRVLPTGVKLPPLPERESMSERKIQFLYVGRLTASKGVDKLILSLPCLRPELRDRMEVHLVGSGEDEEKLKRLCASHDLKEVVTFHGFVEHAEVGRFYEAADVFLFPSFVEGFSLALLEAMSYGLACIVHDYGLPFTEDDIFIIEDNDPETIAGAVASLVKAPQRIAYYGENARKTVEREYAQSIFCRRHLDLYRKTARCEEAGDSVTVSENIISQNA